jgi:hypothetical protein
LSARCKLFHHEQAIYAAGINMENPLQTRSANAIAGYTTYYAEAIGRNTSDSGGTPFFLPDEEDDTPADENSEDSLAQQYDLEKHLDSDRTTFAEKPSECLIKEQLPAEIIPSMPPSDADSATFPSIYINDARALASRATQPVLPRKIMEKIAAKNADYEQTNFVAQKAITGKSLYQPDNQTVTDDNMKQGTRRAYTTSDMVRLSDNLIVNNSLSTETTTLSADDSAYDRQQNDNRNSRRQSEYANSVENNAGAAAVAAFSTESLNGTTQGKTLKLPRMQEISQAILDEIERMRTDPDSNSVSLSLNLPGGDKLDMRLRWRGSDVRVTFSQDDESFRGEIENGWGSLVLAAGNSGVSLDIPHFETISTETSKVI